MELVRCAYCERPSAFYVKINKKLTRVTGTMLRLTTKRSKEKLYAHELCMWKATKYA